MKTKKLYICRWKNNLKTMKMKNKFKLRLSLMMVAAMPVFSGMYDAQAQDWSQWRGPNREGIVKDASLNLDWSAKKPAQLWVFRQAGSGFAAPTVAGTTLYGQGAGGGNDFAFALDTQTGTLKWKQNLGEMTVLERGDGPRGSVTVDGDKLYLVRGSGQMHCLSATDGKMLWQKDFKKDFGGKMMSNWGYSESPLVDGNMVICTPGGSKGTMVALDKNTGAVVWACKEWTDDAAYSSPILAEVDGVRQYIQLSAKNVAGVAAKDGKLLWKVALESSSRVAAVIPTPIFYNDMVYITSGYGIGCILVKLTWSGNKMNAETVYANKNMENQHGGVVLMNGYIYGYTETRYWVCQDLKTGEPVWRERKDEIGKGSVLGVNDRLLLFDMQTGLLAVVAASQDGWKEFGSMKIPERTKISTQDNLVWTHPVIANSKLYLRDHDLLFCFDLKK